MKGCDKSTKLKEKYRLTSTNINSSSRFILSLSSLYHMLHICWWCGCIQLHETELQTLEDQALSSSTRWWDETSPLCLQTQAAFANVFQSSLSCDRWLAIAAVCQTSGLLLSITWAARQSEKTGLSHSRAWNSNEYARFVPIRWIQRVLWLWWSTITYQHFIRSCLNSSLSQYCVMMTQFTHSFLYRWRLKMEKATGSCWTITRNMIVEKKTILAIKMLPTRHFPSVFYLRGRRWLHARANTRWLRKLL